jgi:hypothetical protein
MGILAHQPALRRIYPSAGLDAAELRQETEDRILCKYQSVFPSSAGHEVQGGGEVTASCHFCYDTAVAVIDSTTADRLSLFLIGSI